jgi:hypothetical protein
MDLKANIYKLKEFNSPICIQDSCSTVCNIN